MSPQKKFYDPYSIYAQMVKVTSDFVIVSAEKITNLSKLLHLPVYAVKCDNHNNMTFTYDDNASNMHLFIYHNGVWIFAKKEINNTNRGSNGYE